MARNPGSSRRGRTLLLLLLLSLGFGAVAALIASPTHAPAPSGPGQYQPVPAVIFVDLLAAGVPTAFLIWLVFTIHVRQRQGPSNSVQYGLLTFLIVVFIVVGLLSLGGLLHQSAWPGQAGPAQPTNGTSPGGGGGNTTGLNSSGSGALPRASLSLPSWVWYAIAGFGVALTALIALLYVLSARAHPSSDPDEARRAIREEFTRALRRLAESDPEDPREVIRALYARLLLRLQLRISSTEVLTAREIERTLVHDLGVHSGPAGQLTRLFEEARYSSRPLRPNAVADTRRALELVLEDLGGTIPEPLPAKAA
ncbi:MAG: DUF4129 domain-containing protein [Thermoplasmata archaeon]|nr:DUF4129 domain-containing protein [Thermoplasmata archaeon]MCI4337942.1 DUF4129 domain-containing protein [Thermoplasmata archaeon]MCI4340824.1 DUF4129 domain-containing protein [Thermoplasmata archaeon]